MTIALIILAFIIGYVRKGRIKNLAHLEIKVVPLLLLAFIIQIGIYFGYKFNIEMIQNYDILLHFVSYIILFAGLMGNFDNKWFILVTVGVVCNFMVIFLNGGKMPVSFDAGSVIGISADGMNSLINARAGTHQELQSGSLLWFLSDIIPIKLPSLLKFFNNIYSVGDFILYAGMMGLIQSAMVGRKDEELQEPMNEDIVPDLEYQAFKAENHIDDIYMHDDVVALQGDGIQEYTPSDFLSSSSDETIVLKVNQFNLNSAEDHNESADEYELLADIPSEDEETKKTVDTIEDSIEIEMSREQEEYKEEIESDLQQIEIEDQEFLQSDSMEESQIVETSEVEKEPQAVEVEEPDINFGIVDTTHQFIIVDGKIKENPNYSKNQVDFESSEESLEIENRVNKLEEVVEELEMTQLELEPQKVTVEEADELHLLQKITDNERVDLMKKMKERKENGYVLVEVEVGNKKINFWKKEL